MNKDKEEKSRLENNQDSINAFKESIKFFVSLSMFLFMMISIVIVFLLFLLLVPHPSSLPKKYNYKEAQVTQAKKRKHQKIEDVIKRLEKLEKEIGDLNKETETQ